MADACRSDLLAANTRPSSAGVVLRLHGHLAVCPVGTRRASHLCLPHECAAAAAAAALDGFAGLSANT